MVRTLLLAASMLMLAACASNRTEEVGEFDDAEAVLDDEQVVRPDEELASEPLVLPPPFENADWKQAGGEAAHTMIHVAAPESLERAWRRRVITGKAKSAPVTHPPILGPERLYYIDAVAAVRAFDARTGEEAWTTTLTPDVRDRNRARYNIFARIDPADLGFGGGAALSNGRLFVTSGYGFVAALDAQSGELLWQTEAPGPMRNPPTAAEGLVIAVSISNEVIALDQETGEEVWSFQSFEESARVLAAAAPAVDSQSVIVPFSSGEVTALSLGNGRIQWQAVISRTSRLDALSTLGDIAGSPVVDRGAVFSVSQSGQMAGIDLRTGQVAWEEPVGGSHMPWLAGETIFVLSNRNELVAVNRIDGRIRWTSQMPTYRNERKRKGRINWAGPVLAGGKLYLTGTNGRLIAASPENGEIIERYKLRSGSTQPPVVAGNMVYVLNDRGEVEAFRAASPAR